MAEQGGGFTAIVIIHHRDGATAAGARADEAAERVTDDAACAAAKAANDVVGDTLHDVANEATDDRATHNHAAPVTPTSAIAPLEDDGCERTTSARRARAQLSPTDRMVLDHLRSCVEADGVTRRVRLRELCEACGVCRNTTRSSLKRLERHSLAVRQQEFSGIQEGCKYRVVFDAGASPLPPSAPLPNADDAMRAAPPSAARDVHRASHPRPTLRLV